MQKLSPHTRPAISQGAFQQNLQVTVHIPGSWALGGRQCWLHLPLWNRGQNKVMTPSPKPTIPDVCRVPAASPPTTNISNRFHQGKGNKGRGKGGYTEPTWALSPGFTDYDPGQRSSNSQSRSELEMQEFLTLAMKMSELFKYPL